MDQYIKKYKIVREIGKGGMGIVYRALDIESQKHVALKILPPNMVDRATVERFTREAQAMARLKHHNLIEVYNYGMSDGKHYFAMEFIEGETLKAIVMKEKCLPIEESLRIIVCVAEALAYIHKEGIVHRDVKPANIMVTNDGRIKLMDFGLVHIAGVTKVTAEGSSVGTAEYMSPEQIFDEQIDSRTDIYSLGVTLYEMLIGHPPFQGETAQAVLMKHKYDFPMSPKHVRPEIPAEVERITMKAIAKDVSTRYQKVQEMIDDIKRFQGEAVAPKLGIKSPKSSPLILRKFFRITCALLIIGTMTYGGYRYRENIAVVVMQVLSKVKWPVKDEKTMVQDTQQQMKIINWAEQHYVDGQKYYKAGDLISAIAEFRMAIKIRKDYGLYYKDLATAYEDQGEKALAIEAWNNLLRYDRSGTFAETAVEHLDHLKKNP